MRFTEETAIPLEVFFEAYYACRKNKRNTLNALAFEVDYTDNLIQLWKDVNSRRYEIGSSICFIVTRPKLREVFAADFRDRIIHHVIMHYLEPLFEATFIDDNYSCRKGKGVLYGVNRLYSKIYEISEGYSKDCYLGRFDVKGFFMHIHKPTLWRMLREFIVDRYHGNDKETLLWLTEMAVMNCPQDKCERRSRDSMWDELDREKSLFSLPEDRGLPIGNLTSQCFANFYMDGFDKMMVGSLGSGYGRYVDDFFVICPTMDGVKDAFRTAKGYLEGNLSLTLHSNKLYMQHYSKGMKFIGAVVRNGRKYIAQATLSNAFSKIKSIGRMRRTKKRAESLAQSLNSYLGLMRSYATYNARSELFSSLPLMYVGIVLPCDGCRKAVLTK